MTIHRPQRVVCVGAFVLGRYRASRTMKFAQLDTVILRRDMPEHGLLAGDLGAVVEVYGQDGLEVEFVQASGRTKALVTLKTNDVRAVSANDILAVRTA